MRRGVFRNVDLAKSLRIHLINLYYSFCQIDVFVVVVVVVVVVDIALMNVNYSSDVKL